MTKFRRVYEAAILKTLGATRRIIATMLLLEYGVLGALAGVLGRRRRGRPDLGAQPLRLRDPVAAAARLCSTFGVVATGLVVSAVGVGGQLGRAAAKSPWRPCGASRPRSEGSTAGPIGPAQKEHCGQ